MSIWDDEDIKASVGAYFKLTNVGDEIAGILTAMAKRPFVDAKSGVTTHHAELTFMCDDGVERIFTAGQIQTKIQLDEIRPEIGDWLSIKLTGLEKRPTGQLKNIKVTHRKGDGTAPVAAAAAPAQSSKPPF